MEDVLKTYKRPDDANRPLICMVEMPKQLLSENRKPLTDCPGKPTRQDYEYNRQGVTDVFMLFEPQVGKCRIETSDRCRIVERALMNRQKLV